MAINGVTPSNPVRPATTSQVRAAEARGADVSKAEAFVAAAEKFIGQPYEYGAGHNPNYGQMPPDPKVQPVDCSGLVGQAAAMVGANLDGTARDQRRLGQAVPKEPLQAGDLVFRPRGEGQFHVGIYDGKGNIIQAPQTGETVRSDPYNPAEWTQAVRPWLGNPNATTLPANVPVPLPRPDRSADASSAVAPVLHQPPSGFDF